MGADESPESITIWLREWAGGDEQALENLIPLVYDELRRLAEHSLRNERQPTTATSLVHDLFLELVQQKKIVWHDRGHFFGISAHILRRLLVSRARRRQALKRGGGVRILNGAEDCGIIPGPGPYDQVDLIVLDQALDRLAGHHPRMARIVELRYFGGMSLEETADTAGVSLATAKRHWQFARHWLHRELSANGKTASGEPNEPSESEPSESE